MHWLNEKVIGMFKSTESKKGQTSVLLTATVGALEDVLFWKNMWLTLYFIFLFNVVFFVCLYYQINILHFTFCLTATILIMDAFEIWLKHKHRTSFLKRLSSIQGPELKVVFAQIYDWLQRRYNELLLLRESNQTKAFLLNNIILGFIYIIGVYINGYLLLYTIIMSLFGIQKFGPAVIKLMKKLQHTESDADLEGLIPEVSEADIQLLSIEPEQRQPIEDKQSLDWRPEEPFPDDESGDSSENSSSFVSNLSTQRVNVLEQDVETSDSSEDEYIPLVQQREQLQSTLEVLPDSWGSTAYNALRNLTGTLSSFITSPPETRRKRVSSIDSSDGFEMIDKNDIS